MLRIRVVPTLLISQRKLLKTKQFGSPRYVGDPINAVKIFNEKGADELVFLDISASQNKCPPDFDLISEISGEAFMPVAYGGGVDSIDAMRKIFSLGVEKVSINTAALINPDLISKGAALFGSQSIVVSMDVRSCDGKYMVCSKHGSVNTGIDAVAWAKQAESLGAGELLVTFVEREGMRNGYELPLFRTLSDSIRIPIIASGGAGSFQDIKTVVQTTNVSAAAAGSFFVFHGRREAVLITYPTQQELDELQGVRLND